MHLAQRPLRLIYSENPVEDQWRMLLRYSYATGVENWLRTKSNAVPVTAELVDTISGSLQQAEEYFKLAASSTLYLRPMLVYYGATHLLLAAGCLLEAKTPDVMNHGLKMGVVPHSGPIGATDAMICNPNNGAFSLYSKIFSRYKAALPTGHSWTLMNFLGSIPDLYEDLRLSYPETQPHVVPVEIVQQGESVAEIISIHQMIQTFEFNMESVVDYRSSYVNAVRDGDSIIMFRRLDYQDFGEYSLSGTKHLCFAHLKGGKVWPCQVSSFLGGLYILGNLARYSPRRWHRFIRTDDTGERHLFDRFTSLACRKIPHIVLEMLEGCSILFGMREA